MDYNYMEYLPYMSAQGFPSQPPQPPHGFPPQPPQPPHGFPPQPPQPPHGFPPQPPQHCNGASCGWHGMPYYRPVPGMPYHMAHPYPVFAQSDEDERDLERLRSMLPEAARLVQPAVEEECDKMEYDGSLMFDEYPDKLMVEQLVERIYQNVQNSSPDEEEPSSEDGIFASSCRNCNGNRFGDGLSDLITVMLFEEMHRRRCRHRKCKRWW